MSNLHHKPADKKSGKPSKSDNQPKSGSPSAEEIQPKASHSDTTRRANPSKATLPNPSSGPSGKLGVVPPPGRSCSTQAGRTSGFTTSDAMEMETTPSALKTSVFKKPSRRPKRV
ncbi:hypothetical protein GE061_016956 [Apolygus lucorum]|uniref:Uncharacterized protein n=1 Tax=Apolygus lucorum TaxID=248454 RepID=A0A8S9XJQ8_APOLU|nr:hypothetical protein GE061_016956 [Apolygus lucorum]